MKPKPRYPIKDEKPYTLVPNPRLLINCMKTLTPGLEGRAQGRLGGWRDDPRAWSMCRAVGCPNGDTRELELSTRRAAQH